MIFLSQQKQTSR